MVKVIASSEIDAPIALVYDVMMDFARYAEWNPFVVGVTGELRVGGLLTLDVIFHDGSRRPTRGCVEVITAPGDKAELTYRYAGPFAPFRLVRGTRQQLLTRLDANRTRYDTSECFTGLLTPFLPAAGIQRGFDDVARELKRRAEHLARRDGGTRN
jgi:hypothetical protein